MAFQDCCSETYTDFGPDAHKQKQNVTQDMYFDTYMHLRNVIQCKRRGLLNEKVILIHDNARSHKVQLN